MRAIMVLMIMMTGQALLAQSSINKSFSVQPGQKINFFFDHPELIKFSTWDKNEVNISGSVSVNGGENDDAFNLSSSADGGVVNIRGEMKDLKSLPHRYTVVRDGRKM